MVPSLPRLAAVRLPRTLRLVLLAALAGAVAGSAIGCSSAKPDLPKRPQDRSVMRERGRAMIDSVVVAHGGMANWNKVTEMTFRSTDEWKPPLDKTLNPWPEERASGQSSFRVHQGLGRIAIATVRGTLTYGVGKYGPWALLRGEPTPEQRDQRSATYVVAWHNFLAGLPFRFAESGAVAHYLGRAHRPYQNTSQEFDETLVTYPPDSELWPDDWFLLRTDPVSHEMRTLTYTTTHRAPKFFETTCEFSDYVTVDGLRIPTKRICTVTQPIDEELHTWKLSDVRFDQISPDSYFERRGAGPPDTVQVAGAAADSAAAARH